MKFIDSNRKYINASGGLYSYAFLYNKKKKLEINQIKFFQYQPEKVSIYLSKCT